MHEQSKGMMRRSIKKALSAIHRLANVVNQLAHRIGAWLNRRRNVLAMQALSGAAYKAGTVAVTLLAVWWQNRH
jgi:hypothetical protein